jgi:hypothetical protein
VAALEKWLQDVSTQATEATFAKTLYFFATNISFHSENERGMTLISESAASNSVEELILSFLAFSQIFSGKPVHSSFLCLLYDNSHVSRTLQLKHSC